MTRQLATQLASDIQQYIAAQQLPTGTRLPERSLAEHFRVSRSPVREALKRLAAQSVLEAHEDGGYVVAALDRSLFQPAAPAADAANDSSESIYLQIADDRLQGVLPDRVTENELIRRYGPTRSQLNTILRRIVQEGWIERLPGHGWEFLPTLSSSDAYTQSYRFRLMLEPQALLEASYRLDAGALKICQIEQQALVDGGLHTASPAQLFDANTHLHETIAGFSGNLFVIESLKRLNRVRRLMEYRKAVDRGQAARRCQEHLTLIDMLLCERREAAADFLRLHLRDAAREKAALEDSRTLAK